MSLPSLAADDAGDRAAAEQARLSRAATEAVELARRADLDLDDVRGAALAFEAIADAAAAVPLPAGGHTRARFAGLAAVASVDVTLGRLVEAHTDALAILAELGATRPAAGERWAVWAAEGPQSTATVTKTAGGWRIDGTKPWCSGATFCTRALVTAEGPGGRSLYAVTLQPDSAVAHPGSWRAVGLSGSSTESVTLKDAPATPVGAAGEYLSRAGFWHGAIGVAAVWWGAAVGIAAPLYESAAAGRLGAHALAHLGAVETTLTASAALLRQAAVAIDSTGTAEPVGELTALTVRAAVESSAGEVIERVGRALGPSPLCQDRAHARRVADLSVYLRQSHAERDLERIGRLTAEPR